MKLKMLLQLPCCWRAAGQNQRKRRYQMIQKFSQRKLFRKKQSLRLLVLPLYLKRNHPWMKV